MILARLVLAGPSRLPVSSSSRCGSRTAIAIAGLRASSPIYHAAPASTSAPPPRRPIRPAQSSSPPPSPLSTPTLPQTVPPTQSKRSSASRKGAGKTGQPRTSTTTPVPPSIAPTTSSTDYGFNKSRSIPVPPLTAPWPYRPVSNSLPAPSPGSLTASASASATAQSSLDANNDRSHKSSSENSSQNNDNDNESGEAGLESETIEEERTIFARPFEQGRPKMYWFAAMISGLFATAWVLLPPRPGELPVKEGEEKHYDTPKDILIGYASSLAVGIPAIIAVTFLFLPSRYITRLSQVRIRQLHPNATSAGATTDRVFFRIRHGGHEMWNPTSKRSQPREVEMRNVKVRLLAGGRVRSPYLTLEIAPTRPRSPPFSYFSFDAFPYRLDFRDSPMVELTDQEVVLSLNRLEHVFGRLDPGGKALGPIETRSV